MLNNLKIIPLLVLLFGSSMAQQQSAPRGAILSGQTAFQSMSYKTKTLSNSVSTLVSGYCRVKISPDGTTSNPWGNIAVNVGKPIILDYFLENLGNGIDNYYLQPLIYSSSNWVPKIRLVHDLNQNGKEEVGEPETGTIGLAQGGVARVLMIIEPPTTAEKAAMVSLKGVCEKYGIKTEDIPVNHYAQLTVYNGTLPSLTKKFSQTVIKRGTDTEVVLQIHNDSADKVNGIDVVDDLSTEGMAGMEYAAGLINVRPEVARVEFFDGNAWNASDSNISNIKVKKVRIRIDTLAAGEYMQFNFKIKAKADTFAGTRLGSAVLLQDTVELRRASAMLMVDGTRQLLPDSPAQHHLGPISNAQALPEGEGSANDSQVLTSGIMDQPICFDHTLKNSSSHSDTFKLSFLVEQGALDTSRVSYYLGGIILPEDKVSLSAGTQTNEPLTACYFPKTSGVLKVRLIATSETYSGSGAASRNSTLDVVTGVSEPASKYVVLKKTVSPEATVPVGGTLTYTLLVENTYGFALTTVELLDRLDPNVEFVSASDGGTFTAAGSTQIKLTSGLVRWQLDSIPAGAKRAVTVQVRVKNNITDGTLLTNEFSLSDDHIVSPIRSNVASLPVWSSALMITKQAAKDAVILGDRVRYTIKVKNASTSTQMVGLKVQDYLPSALVFVADSVNIQWQGKTYTTHPKIEGANLVWSEVCEASGCQTLSLDKGEQLEIAFDARFVHGEYKEIENTAQAFGQVQGNSAQVVSSIASAKVFASKGIFADNNMIVGRVYLDYNQNGTFEPETDKPLKAARIITATGRSIIADATGRYSIDQLPSGMYSFRLDPYSAPFVAEARAYDYGKAGARMLNVRGLMTVDFPLSPAESQILSITRDAVLRYGPLTVFKSVRQDHVNPKLYHAEVTLKTTQDLPEFSLRESLPEGGELVSGEANPEFEVLSVGTHTIRYDFIWDGYMQNVMVDPQVRWRYP